MGGLAAWIEELNGKVNSFAWGPLMLALLVGTGIYLSIRTRFVFVRRFAYMMRHTADSLLGGKGKAEKRRDANLSPFQAAATSLAGTVGTGNIAGVAGAIFAGGPGAVFWMWVSALFGMCTKYSEIALSLKYREKDDAGRFRGGPMYYITNGLGRGRRWLAVTFALFGGLASFGIGNLSQSSEISGAMRELVGMKPLVTGVILAAVVGAVLFGGVKRIGTVTSVLVPFMSLFFILCGLTVITLRISSVPAAFLKILRGAFSLRAAGGGALGCSMLRAVRQGAAKGVFSNEAGLGSAPIAHAASSAEEPVEQAMWGVFEVFIDTFVICTITAFAVILSGALDAEEGLEAFPSNGAAVASAFSAILPGGAGGAVIQISLPLFALSSILSWSYCGQICWEYVSGGNKTVETVYKAAFILACVAGAAGSGTLMWSIADTLNGLMALPNLIALISLGGTVAKLTEDYFTEKNKKPGARARGFGGIMRGSCGRRDRARARNSLFRCRTTR